VSAVLYCSTRLRYRISARRTMIKSAQSKIQLDDLKRSAVPPAQGVELNPCTILRIRRAGCGVSLRVARGKASMAALESSRLRHRRQQRDGRMVPGSSRRRGVTDCPAFEPLPGISRKRGRACSYRTYASGPANRRAFNLEEARVRLRAPPTSATECSSCQSR